MVNPAASPSKRVAEGMISKRKGLSVPCISFVVMAGRRGLPKKEAMVCTSRRLVFDIVQLCVSAPSPFWARAWGGAGRRKSTRRQGKNRYQRRVAAASPAGGGMLARRVSIKDVGVRAVFER